MPAIRFRHLASAILPFATLSVVALSVVAQPVGGDDVAPTSAVAAIVTVPKPWYAPRSIVTSRMRDTVPEYENLPGLAFKAYSFARVDGAYGGLYLWKNLAAARAQFSPAWFERVQRERGVAGTVRLLEVPVALDNTPGGTPRDLQSTSVGTVVSVPVPASVGRAQLVAGFQAALPTYRAVPGLLVKYFTLGSDNTFGGVYLWKDVASAERWFDAAWHQRVREQCGAQARIEWFDTPILLPTRNPANQPAIPGWAAAHSTTAQP